MAVNSIQSSIYQGYGTAAQALLADTHNVFRGQAGVSNPTQGSVLLTLPAVFTNAKLAGNNFTKGIAYDDVVLTGLFDGSNCQPGDFLVDPTTGSVYFIIGMQPFLPILCVQANRTASATRSISQLSPSGGSGDSPLVSQPNGSPYWGRQGDTGDTTPVVAPCCMIASAGRATSRSDMPSAAPGPSRFRIYMPISVFPKGSLKDRDIITDEEGNRFQVEAAGWTNQGYRLEAIRLEM